MLKILRQSVAALLATAFALMFAIFIAQIVARYFFNAPLTWTEEAIRILYIWIIFGSVGTTTRSRAFCGRGGGARRAMPSSSSRTPKLLMALPK